MGSRRELDPDLSRHRSDPEAARHDGFKSNFEASASEFATCFFSQPRVGNLQWERAFGSGPVVDYLEGFDPGSE